MKPTARAFDWRGLELNKAISFANSAEGFTCLLDWSASTSAQKGKNRIIIGMEPTGHYWFNLASHLKGTQIKLVLVNPYHVKQGKELDDGHPSKNDQKDPKTIAKLVLEGRYSVPYIPEGLYSELRVVMNLRWRILKELTSVENRTQRWLNIYFPEHGKVLGSFTGTASMDLLRNAPLPIDLVSLGADKINAIWMANEAKGRRNVRYLSRHRNFASTVADRPRAAGTFLREARGSYFLRREEAANKSL